MPILQTVQKAVEVPQVQYFYSVIDVPAVLQQEVPSVDCGGAASSIPGSGRGRAGSGGARATMRNICVSLWAFAKSEPQV